MIEMTSRLFEQVKREAANAYPEECCGALLGRVQESGGVKQVEEVYLLPNAKERERERRFLITPDQYRVLEKRAEGEALEILGIYHSHPDHPAEPSPFDLAHALPWWSYIIISVENGQTNDVKSWTLQDDRSRFSLEEIRIMSIKVLIPTPLRSYTDQKGEVVVDGHTVGEVLIQLTSRYPLLKPHLYAENGKLRSFVNIYINDEDIRHLRKEETALSEKDILSIIPAIAGGF